MSKYGMSAEVLRSADNYDCTNGGVTSMVSRVQLFGHEVPAIFEIKEEDTALEVLMQPSGHVYAKPIYDEADERNGKHHMFGGNFVYSGDSRMTKHPIPVHDRVEY